MKQTIYLIQAAQHAGEWHFVVEGTTSASYKVTLMDGLCRCTCRDFYGRQRICKHIYFIIGRVARLPDMMQALTDDPTDFEMTEELNCALVMAVHNARDAKPTAPVGGCTLVEECPICFDNVEVDTVACGQCRHNFHAGCMRRWWANKKTSCPLCRAAFVDPASGRPSDYLAKFRPPSVIVDLTRDSD